MSPWARVFLLLTVASIAACKSGAPIPLINPPDLPSRSPERLLEQVLANSTETFAYYSAKANIELVTPENDRNFKAQIRIVRDSAAWVSVVPALGIEVARLLLTTDSVKMIDKLQDRYFVGDLDSARTKFGLQPRLQFFQDAITGKPVGLDPDGKYRSDREDGLYVLTDRDKRRFVRAAEELAPDSTDREMGERKLERTLRKAEEKEAVVHRYWIDPETYRVTRVLMMDLAHDRSADIRYEERAGQEFRHLPTRLQITLNEPGRKVTGTLELSRIQLDGPLMMHFTIPAKFEPMP